MEGVAKDVLETIKTIVDRLRDMTNIIEANEREITTLRSTVDDLKKEIATLKESIKKSKTLMKYRKKARF